MTTRQRMALLAGLLLAALLAVYAYRRRRAVLAAHPDWLDPGQPPEGVAAQVTTLTPGEFAAAYGCPSMTAACAPFTARADIMRTYPPTLAAHDGSVIRGEFTVGGEIR